MIRASTAASIGAPNGALFRWTACCYVGQPVECTSRGRGIIRAVVTFIRVVLIVVGVLFLLVMALVLALGLWLVVSGHSATAITGQLWFELDNGSLNLVQAITQRYVAPFLWDPLAITVLNWPLWQAVPVTALIAGLIGIILLALAWPRARPRRRGRFS